MTPSPKFDPAAWQPEIKMSQFVLDNGLTLLVLPDAPPAHSLPADSLQGGLPARAARHHRHLPPLRASHVPGHRHAGARGVLPHPPGQGRRDQRLHHPGPHFLLRKSARGAPGVGALPGSRPPAAPEAGRRDLRAGTPGGHQRAQAALGGQPLRAGGGAAVRHGLHPAPLPAGRSSAGTRTCTA